MGLHSLDDYARVLYSGQVRFGFFLCDSFYQEKSNISQAHILSKDVDANPTWIPGQKSVLTNPISGNELYLAEKHPAF